MKKLLSFLSIVCINYALREYPEYTPQGYYALFFKDLDGIQYEIVCTTQKER